MTLRETASAAVVELMKIVSSVGYGAEVWYRDLSDIRDVIADPERSDEIALSDASEMFDSLYDGPRNFSDFYIWRDEEAERSAANQRLEAVVSDLKRILSGA